MVKKILLILSTLALLYITLLVALSYTSYESANFNIVAQIITIPTILFTVGCFVFSIIKLILKEKNYLIVMGVNTLTIILMVIFTIIQT